MVSLLIEIKNRYLYGKHIYYIYWQKGDNEP